MKDVFDMTQQEFLEELYLKTDPAMILHRAPDIYDYMSELFGQSCGDSVLREWAFQWASMKLGISYDVFYNRWLGE